MKRLALTFLLGAAAGCAVIPVYRAAYARRHKPSPRLETSLRAALGPVLPPRDRWLMQAAGAIAGSLDGTDEAEAVYVPVRSADGLVRTCALERGEAVPWVTFGDFRDSKEGKR